MVLLHKHALRNGALLGLMAVAALALIISLCVGEEETSHCKPTSSPTSVRQLADREVLEVLYQATDGPNWENNNNWLSAKPLNDWFGVTTDSYGRIIELRLGENQLRGYLPPELATLQELETLYLGGNLLEGCVPGKLSELPNSDVTYLAIPICDSYLDRQALIAIYKSTDGPSWEEDGNWLSDKPLDTWYGVTTNIDCQVVKLDLFWNRLSGKIPPEIGNLTKLERLSLAVNQLMDAIPPNWATSPICKNSC